MKKKHFLIYPLLVMGLFLVFASSCIKEYYYNYSDTLLVTTTAVTDISYNTATSGGNITNEGGTNIKTRGVCWSTKQNPTIRDNKTEDGSGEGSFTSNITGLESNTTYYVRAYATYTGGKVYGNEISFSTVEGGAFTDSRDGNTYNWVKIGEQVWMAENLKYLPSVVVPSTGSETTPYYYVYGYDGSSVTTAKSSTNYTTYGVLYNWAAAMAGTSSSTTNPSGVQGVCPAGWHLPSDAEWTQLTDFLGGESDAGDKLKESGTSHWSSPNEGATNEYGFTALPGGYRSSNGTFYDIGNYGYWWSATEYNASYAWYRLMLYNLSKVYRFYYNKELGFSVRCVRDN